MNKSNLQIENILINKIKDNPRNSRKHPDSQIKLISRSIKEYGFNKPLIVDKKYILLAGHGTLLAAKTLKMKSVPVVQIPLTGKKAREYMIADNSLSEMSRWDKELLIKEIGELKIDIGQFGFKDLHIPGNNIVDDLEISEDVETEIKYGDMISIGRHLLLCGDCTDKVQVKELLNGMKADMVFTDPPYGVNVKGGKTKKNIAGDLTQVLIPFSFEICMDVATSSSARFYFCGGEQNYSLYAKLFERHLSQIPKMIIWVKNGFVMKPNEYHNQYELVFYGFRAGSGGKKNWFSGRTMEEASDVWQIKRDSGNTYEHPTQKPVEIPSRAMRNSTPEGALIYEPFSGSGSTFAAAQLNNRICYGLEIEPKYCQVTINRLRRIDPEIKVKCVNRDIKI